MGRHWLIQKNKNREGRWEDSTSYITTPTHPYSPPREKRTHYNAKKNLFNLHVETRVLQDKDLKCYVTAAPFQTAYKVIYVTCIASVSVAHTAPLWPQHKLQREGLQSRGGTKTSYHCHRRWSHKSSGLSGFLRHRHPSVVMTAESRAGPSRDPCRLSGRELQFRSQTPAVALSGCPCPWGSG